jgi:hypothetical protein
MILVQSRHPDNCISSLVVCYQPSMRQLLNIERLQSLSADHIQLLHNIQLRQKLYLLPHHHQTLTWIMWIMSLASLAKALANQSVLRRSKGCWPYYVKTHHVCCFLSQLDFISSTFFLLISGTTRDFQVLLYSDPRSSIFAFNSLSHT